MIPAVFFKKAIESVPRVLGLCDRDPASPTFGCCDRNYWHYRLTDVSNARFQEAGLVAALAYTVPAPASGPDNPFYGNENLRRWIGGIWNFWLHKRNGDGSVNEVYPYERSFCATAFSAAAFVQTVFLTGGADAWKQELELAGRTMKWLAQHRQSDTANQMAASLLALTGYAALTGQASDAEAARVRRDEVLRLADAEGVFGEYGGLDTGYQSITMSLLARTNALSGGDLGLMGVLKAGEKILEQKIAVSGDVDASANSRNTQFIYPYALAVLKEQCVSDGVALDRLTGGLECDRVICPQWMDDRYCVPFAADYFMTSEGFFKCE